MKYYTIGEINRLKALLSSSGKPYGDKSTVRVAVNRLQYTVIDTPWGKAKALTQKQIEDHNAKHLYYYAENITPRLDRSPHTKVRR